MTCEAYEEIIAAHVDGVLTPTELREVERHLQSCAQCSQLFAEQSEFHTAFTARRLLVPLPAETEERLRLALAKETEVPIPFSPTSSSLWSRLSAFFTPPRFAIGLAAASILGVLLFLRFFSNAPEPILFPQAVDSYRAVIDQQRQLDYAITDPYELEVAFNVSGRLDFVTKVADLRPAGYRLRGGSIVTLQHRLTAVAVYDKEANHIVCLRQGGKLPPLPPDIEVVHGHYVYSRDGYTVVYSQFRRFYCLMISRLPKEQFLRSFGME